MDVKQCENCSHYDVCKFYGLTADKCHWYKNKSGEWQRTDAHPHWLVCSACHTRLIANDEIIEMYSMPIDFCPACGADMRKE